MHMYRLPRLFTERSSWPPPGGSVEQPISQTVLKILALTSILVITIMMAGGCSLLFSTADPIGDQKPNSYTCQCTAFISDSGFCGIDDAACTFDSDCTSGTCSNNQSICNSDDDCSGGHTCEGIGADICVGAESIGPKDFNICVPDQLNPNKDGEAANDGDLDLDCRARVQEITVGIVQQCTAESLVEVMCEAAPASTQKYFDLCDEECVPELLSADGNNCDTANITVDTSAQDPVCLSEDGSILGVAGLPGVAAALRSRSTCDVTGEIIVTVDGDQKAKPTQGVVEFIGEPCPGQSCDIGMFSRIDEVGTFKFSEFFGVASTEIKNIRGIGSSLSTATVDATGIAAFDNTLGSGRGRREDFLVGGIPFGSESASIVAINDDDIDVNVNWTGQGATCSVDGALLGEIESSEASVIAMLAGSIVNEPPKANAGGDRAVECTSPAGAIVTLDAGGSTDPQGNIALTQWRLGELTGSEIGVQDPVAQIEQALGAVEDYYLNVMDEFWQVSTDIASVSVVDTTPPEITCPDPQIVECTGNSQAPITYQATASDICWESLSPTCNPLSGSSFALGNTTVSCSVTDGSSNSSSCNETMTVVDTKPPVIESLTAVPSLLWPPNHKMKRIKLDITASDTCDPTVQDRCRVVEVVSNEPDAGLNEEDIPDDVEIVNADTVRVRAERDENGQGRIYTVTVECTDSINSTQRSVDVFVSHDERK